MSSCRTWVTDFAVRKALSARVSRSIAFSRAKGTMKRLTRQVSKGQRICLALQTLAKQYLAE